MKSYGQIVSLITTTPWMMMPNALQNMLAIVEAHMTGNVTQEAIQAAVAQKDARPTRAPREGKIGLLPLHGPIFPRANMMTQLSGATSLEEWGGVFTQMIEDDSIDSILLDIDSPGGSSALIPETAAMIRQARDVKPIYAVANTMAGSAAYGLAAQATKLYASPSSVVGSIGTYMVHTNDDELMKKLGVEQTVIKEGRFKAVDLERLDDEAKEYMQSLVGDINDVFINEIALGRNMSSDAIRGTEAKVYAAQKSVDVGLSDGVASFEQVLGDLVQGGADGVGLAMAQSVPGVLASTGANTNPIPEPQASYDADKEHSEPGTGLGGEPTPREAPEEGDPAIENGWRRDPPPAAYETEEVVNREWLVAQATTLSLSFDDDTTDEQLAEMVATRMQEIVVPLNDATVEAEQQQQFATMFPEQAAQLAALAQREREGAATAFASRYERFEGQSRGFSLVVRDQIEEAHERVSQMAFTADDLQSLLDAVANQAAVVTYGQQGSSRSSETASATSGGVTGDFKQDRAKFAQLVKQAMTEDSLTREAAVTHVSQNHPDLAAAYAQGHTRR